ncbi:MAG: hypothetical protein JOZ69_05335 [Myxococcales bacterium]|nr:hypothetical protein [Myxococcales bacterium]
MRQHEARGSCILSVIQVLKFPEQVLGPEVCRRARDVDPNGWYSVELLLDLMDRLDKAVGHYGLLRLGRLLFDLCHRERVTQVARSARDILEGMDGMYRQGNRGSDIGGWTLVLFEPGYAELRKNTPYHCVMEQGILSEALLAVGCPGLVSQRECVRRGAEACLYTITSSLTDARWHGDQPLSPAASTVRPASRPRTDPSSRPPPSGNT